MRKTNKYDAKEIGATFVSMFLLRSPSNNSTLTKVFSHVKFKGSNFLSHKGKISTLCYEMLKKNLVVQINKTEKKTAKGSRYYLGEWDINLDNFYELLQKKYLTTIPKELWSEVYLCLKDIRKIVINRNAAINEVVRPLKSNSMHRQNDYILYWVYLLTLAKKYYNLKFTLSELRLKRKKIIVKIKKLKQKNITPNPFHFDPKDVINMHETEIIELDKKIESNAYKFLQYRKRFHLRYTKVVLDSDLIQMIINDLKDYEIKTQVKLRFNIDLDEIRKIQNSNKKDK